MNREDRRKAMAEARGRHRAEGTPPWITGETKPSGCGACGYTRAEHGQGGRHEHAYKAPTEEQIKDRMRGRRRARADWFRLRGYGGCAHCGNPPGTGDHMIGGCHHPFFEGPEDAKPYAEPTDTQVLTRVAWHRSFNWRGLDVDLEDDWYDDGAPTMWELEPDPDYGRDLDDEADFAIEEHEGDDDVDPHDDYDEFDSDDY